MNILWGVYDVFELTEADALRILRALFERTALPVYRGAFDRNRIPGIFDSKLGGLPYWDMTMPYPTGRRGQKLVLLAQIDMSKVPSQGELPKKGMLQFFIDGDAESYGCDFEEPKPGGSDDFRVVWHKTIDRSLTEEALCGLEIPTNHTGADSPVQGEIAISFDSPGTEPISIGDVQLDGAIHRIAAELGIKLPFLFGVNDLLELLPEGTEERWASFSLGLKLLGYPYFTQFDPREEESRYNRLLLQIDSAIGVQWGDGGVANFFIQGEALQNWDLSELFYYWHCG